MKLDRNINEDRSGKYALVRLRRVRSLDPNNREYVRGVLKTLEKLGVLTLGPAGTEDEFFPILLKDRNAFAALNAYADAAAASDEEYAGEVREMLDRAGPNSPFCKDPD